MGKRRGWSTGMHQSFACLIRSRVSGVLESAGRQARQSCRLDKLYIFRCLYFCLKLTTDSFPVVFQLILSTHLQAPLATACLASAAPASTAYTPLLHSLRPLLHQMPRCRLALALVINGSCPLFRLPVYGCLVWFPPLPPKPTLIGTIHGSRPVASAPRIFTSGIARSISVRAWLCDMLSLSPY